MSAPDISSKPPFIADAIARSLAATASAIADTSSSAELERAMRRGGRFLPAAAVEKLKIMDRAAAELAEIARLHARNSQYATTSLVELRLREPKNDTWKADIGRVAARQQFEADHAAWRERMAAAEKTARELREIASDASARWQAAGQVLRVVVDYVADLSAPVTSAPPVKLPAGAPAAIVEKARERIDELRTELAAVIAAPIASSQAKQLITETVARLAAQGRPRVDAVVIHGSSKIEWPRQAVDTTLRDGSPMITAGVSGGLPFMVWLHEDLIVARLHAEVDRIADDAEALSDTDRAKKSAALRAEILKQERIEEAAICAQGAGLAPIARRTDADPRAILELADTAPAPREL